MPPDRRDPALLWDMLDAARSVQRFIAGKSLHDYLNDEMLRAAVERKVEIIGEAARFVSDAVRTAHPEIPWHKITSQRHILSHEYGDIDDQLIWRVATIHIPTLIAQLEPIVPEPPENS